ncbi:MAG: hypothetical protein AB1567_10310 [bacterium]
MTKKRSVSIFRENRKFTFYFSCLNNILVTIMNRFYWGVEVIKLENPLLLF